MARRTLPSERVCCGKGGFELFWDEQWVILRTDTHRFAVAHWSEEGCPHWSHVRYGEKRCFGCSEPFSKFINDMLVFLKWQNK